MNRFADDRCLAGGLEPRPVPVAVRAAAGPGTPAVVGHTEPAGSRLAWRLNRGPGASFECRIHEHGDGPLLTVSRDGEIVLVGRQASLEAARERAARLRRLFLGWEWTWLELSPPS